MTRRVELALIIALGLVAAIAANAAAVAIEDHTNAIVEAR